MKVVFLDRDGTIIEPPADRRVDSPNKVRLFPDTIAALRLFALNHFKVVIITNQTGIAEGRFSLETYALINDRLMQLLSPSGVEILKIYTCPHARADNCLCRKPKPKLVYDAAAEFGFNMSGCYVVGDRRDDVELGKAAGLKTILVKTGPFPVYDVQPDDVVATLSDAASLITGIAGKH